MKLLRKTLYAATLASIACVASFASANDLVDPGFENPITYDGPPFVGFWEGFNSGAGTFADSTTNMPRNGAGSLELVIDNTVNGFAGAFQDVYFGPAGAGQDGTFSGWHKAVQGSGVEIRIEWRDSVNNSEISRTPNFAPVPGPDFEFFSLTATAPAGSDTARVVYAIQSFGGVINQNVFVDDVSFSGIVPEPASLALVGLAGAAVLARRRGRK